MKNKNFHQELLKDIMILIFVIFPFHVLKYVLKFAYVVLLIVSEFLFWHGLALQLFAIPVAIALGIYAVITGGSLILVAIMFAAAEVLLIAIVYIADRIHDFDFKRRDREFCKNIIRNC